MDTAFLICAVLGGTLMVLQTLAGMLGFVGDDVDHADGADHDTEHERGEAGHDAHGSNWFVGLLSVRTVAAALAFFGIGGKIAISSGIDELPALGIALGAGALALVIVAEMMRSLNRLKSDGTARVDRAVGRTGTVYLRVPAAKGGPGKIHMSLQNRTVEYQAVTAGNELPTGTPIRVISVVNADTVEVAAV